MRGLAAQRMTQFGMFGRHHGTHGSQVPPTCLRGGTEDAPGKKRVNMPAAAPSDRSQVRQQTSAASPYVTHYGTVAPREELSLSYAARRHQIARQQKKRVLVVIGIAAAVIVVVLLVMRGCSS